MTTHSDAAALEALTPLDGRYSDKLSDLKDFISERGLIERRLRVEAAWLLHLAAQDGIGARLVLSESLAKFLTDLQHKVPREFAGRVKEIERTTNHDVKALEYLLREVMVDVDPGAPLSFIHFACTSEDINNLAYGLMLRELRTTRLLPAMREILDRLAKLAEEHADVAMLARTHGQSASPTTVGKEMAVFGHRLLRQKVAFSGVKILGKLNGATGNFNAHAAAFPRADWPNIARSFVEERLQLSYNPYTTQIENHDGLAELLANLARFNTISIDLSRDLWSYISLGYFKLKTKEGEIGSSTMPHKVNPIDFENAEGNFGIAVSLCNHFCDKLPISRLQRDLSDSTVQRALGTVFGHSILAMRMLVRGLDKLEVNRERLAQDLASADEVLAEPIQTVLRARGVTSAYEELKKATRGVTVNREELFRLVDESKDLGADDKQALKELRPETYTGYAARLAREFAAIYRRRS